MNQAILVHTSLVRTNLVYTQEHLDQVRLLRPQGIPLTNNLGLDTAASCLEIALNTF